MTNQPKPKRSYWLAMVVALPVFYLFSVAAAAKLHWSLDSAGYDVEWLWEAYLIYSLPIKWIYGQNEVTEAFFDWYFGLWGVG